jgi:hypothetical protein
MFVTIVFTMLSIADVCVETLPGVTEKVTIPGCHNQQGEPIYIERAKPQLMRIMIACVVFFSCDIVARLATAPNPLRQLLSVTIICELLSLSPFYISIILDETCYPGDGPFRRAFEFLHILRLCRIFFALGQFKPFKVSIIH